MLCVGMHCNVMLRFIVQAFQNPPLCSSTNIYCRSFAQFCLETEIAQARGTDHLKHLFIFFFFKFLSTKKGITINIFCHRASWFMANLWLDLDIINLLNFGLRGIRMFLIFSCLYFLYVQEQTSKSCWFKTWNLSNFSRAKCASRASHNHLLKAVLRIRIRIRRICMFLGLLDPAPKSGSGSFYQHAKIVDSWFLLFCDFFLTFIFEKWCKCTFKN